MKIRSPHLMWRQTSIVIVNDINKRKNYIICLSAGVRGGPCNPSYWEARIWGCIVKSSPLYGLGIPRMYPLILKKTESPKGKRVPLDWKALNKLNHNADPILFALFTNIGTFSLESTQPFYDFWWFSDPLAFYKWHDSSACISATRK